jgi:hypothetical protein
MGLTSLMDGEGFIDDFNQAIFHYLQSAIQKLDEVIHDINHLPQQPYRP